MKRRLTSLVLTTLAVVAIIGSVSAFTFPADADAISETLEYRWFAGAGEIEGFGALCPDPDNPTPEDGPPCPDVATASNGHTIEIAGEGRLTLHPKSVTGEGTFVHKDANGEVVAEGTWEATQLLSFKEYGPLPVLPDDWRAGLAHIRVDLLVGGEKVAEGILTVGCRLPEIKLPGGVFEGSRLNVQSGLNFNKPSVGSTLFLLQ